MSPTGTVAPEQAQAATAGRSMEVTAWAVLLAALAVFLVGLVGLPYLAVGFARDATVAEGATVESRSGSVQVEYAGETKVVTDTLREVPEGATVSTFPETRAFLTLFDDSVVDLRSNMAVTLERMRHPRFAAGGTGRRIRLSARPVDQDQTGSLRVGSTYGDVTLEVVTPHGEVVLAPAAQASIEVSPDALEVKGIEGQVTVSGAGQSVVLANSERTTVQPDQPPTAPTTKEQNVVVNPDFSPPMTGDGPWALQYDPATPVSLGRAVTLPDGRSVLRFTREGSEGRPGDLYYRQDLGKRDVSEASYLGLTSQLRVLDQELAGGGVSATEFPAIVSLIYQDENGDDFVWETGFYAKPLEPGDTANRSLDENRMRQVKPGEWDYFDSENLLDPDNPRGFTALGLPRPMRLIRLEVKASGHDLESEVDKVGVWVR